MYTKMFMVLFAIINNWKQSNFLSAIEQIYKLWQSYTRILHTDENEQTINTHNTMGQPHKQNVEYKKPDLKNIYCRIPFIQTLKIGKINL